MQPGGLSSRGRSAGSYGGSREELSPCLLQRRPQPLARGPSSVFRVSSAASPLADLCSTSSSRAEPPASFL